MDRAAAERVVANDRNGKRLGLWNYRTKSMTDPVTLTAGLAQQLDRQEKTDAHSEVGRQ